jgi:hypothetical protein
MSIGKVANRVAVGVETLRFYEREGLLEKPTRLNSGYRAYPAATVNRVRFIKRAKELGFSCVMDRPQSYRAHDWLTESTFASRLRCARASLEGGRRLRGNGLRLRAYPILN